jgi:hypothetical protein
MTTLNVLGPCECIACELVAGMGWVVKFKTYDGTLTLVGNESDPRPEYVIDVKYNLLLAGASVKT